MKEIIIVALGDSITNGAGIGDVTEEDTYRHHLQVDLPKMVEYKVKVINAGVNGDITTTAIPRLERDVLQHKPDYVTMMPVTIVLPLIQWLIHREYPQRILIRILKL
jgi:lysophospholipase L1-like esterase